jgi:hypothetical protein
MISVMTFSLLYFSDFAYADCGIVVITDSSNSGRHGIAGELVDCLVALRDANGLTQSGTPIILYDAGNYKDKKIIKSFMGSVPENLPYAILVITKGASVTRKIGKGAGNIKNPVRQGEKMFSNLQGYLGKKTIKLTHLTTGIKVISKPDGAKVCLGGLPKKPNKKGIIELPAGTSTILIKKDNYLDYEKTIELQYGKVEQISVDLVFHKGSLKLLTDPPGAKVVLDGMDSSYKTPLILDDYPAGMHTFVISKPGYKKVTEEIFIDGGKEMEREIKLENYSANVFLEVEVQSVREENRMDPFFKYYVWKIEASDLKNALQKKLEENGSLRPVNSINNADFILKYSVGLKNPMTGEAEIITRYGRTLTIIKAEMERPDGNSDNKCLIKAIEIFEKKILKKLTDELSR